MPPAAAAVPAARARSLLRYWAPPAAYAALIFHLSAQSRLPMDDFIALHDKLLHAVEFGGLSFLLFRALFRASPLSGRTGAAALAGALLATLYAATDEWHQSFVPGRSGEPADLVADAAGAFAACALAPLYGRFARAGNRAGREGVARDGEAAGGVAPVELPGERA